MLHSELRFSLSMLFFCCALRLIASLGFFFFSFHFSLENCSVFHILMGHFLVDEEKNLRWRWEVAGKITHQREQKGLNCRELPLLMTRFEALRIHWRSFLTGFLPFTIVPVSFTLALAASSRSPLLEIWGEPRHLWQKSRGSTFSLWEALVLCFYLANTTISLSMPSSYAVLHDDLFSSSVVVVLCSRALPMTA